MYAFDLIEQDGDELRDLPLIERKRLLAKLLGSAKRAVTRDGTNCISQKLESAQYACRSQRERAS